MLKDLSIFIDESGDFGPFNAHSPYFILSFVIHDQTDDISEALLHLKSSLNYMNYPDNIALHSFPLIRKEIPYVNTSIVTRKKLFSCLMSFMRHAGVKVCTFCFEKNKFSGQSLENALHDAIGDFISSNKQLLNSYDRLIFYYDKGQNQISKILRSIHYDFLDNDEIRIVRPENYALFQAADMACTLELLCQKYPNLSHSEKLFFANSRNLRLNYLRPYKKMKLQ